MDSKIIAVDFDGTLCENKWPQIGEANKEMITYLKGRQVNGDKLILWTCRVDDMLKNAVDWSAEQGLIFDAVNENLPEIVASFGTDTRKIFANEYIDDRNAWYPSDGVADILYLCDGKQCGESCPSKEKTVMLESLLKELGEQHFEVLWRYEVMTNSIVIQMDKRSCHQWHRLARKVTFDDFRHLISKQFEIIMVQFLKEMAQELEYQINVAQEPMKGGNR